MYYKFSKRQCQLLEIELPRYNHIKAQNQSQKYKGMKVLGIRRETKTVEERRCALPPKYVKQLLSEHDWLKVVVQPSEHRIFKDWEFKEIGCEVQEDLSQCDLIIGVKEIACEYLIPNKTYMCFAHVIKAQEQNMETLDEIIAKNIRLIDYERIVDENNNRLIAFGMFAGLAGGIDFLYALSKIIDLKCIINNPFKHMKRCKDYQNLDEAYSDIKVVVANMKQDGLDCSIGPLIIGITGNGRCSKGVQQVMSQLDVKQIDPEYMVEHYTELDKNMIYQVIFSGKDMVQHKNDQQYDRNEYYQDPHKYSPIFAKKYLPYLSVLYHTIYWDQRFPRFISCLEMKQMVQSNNSRLLGICDITCDINGSIEFNKYSTKIDSPYFSYDPVTFQDMLGISDMNGRQIVYESQDYLPSMLPYDSSLYFGSHLVKWIPNIIQNNPNELKSDQKLEGCIERAVITCHKSLTNQYEYIQEIRNVRKTSMELEKFND